ncbi:MAG: hypothetical protein JSS32_06680 [Verrucomicrobia bacterium]|nr:hypothetical protein [Verrucomicrobiota bacterium]
MVTTLGNIDFYEGFDLEIKVVSPEGRFREIDTAEAKQISHYVKGAPPKEIRWQSRRSEVLPNTHEFGKKVSLASSPLYGKVKSFDINPDGTAGGPDNNRDSNSIMDSISDHANRESGGLREYILDKVERYGNGDRGTVVREIYEEIIEPPLVTVLQALGEEVNRNETPP